MRGVALENEKFGIESQDMQAFFQEDYGKDNNIIAFVSRRDLFGELALLVFFLYLGSFYVCLTVDLQSLGVYAIPRRFQ